MAIVELARINSIRQQVKIASSDILATNPKNVITFIPNLISHQVLKIWYISYQVVKGEVTLVKLQNINVTVHQSSFKLIEPCDTVIREWFISLQYGK